MANLMSAWSSVRQRVAGPEVPTIRPGPLEAPEPDPSRRRLRDLAARLPWRGALAEAAVLAGFVAIAVWLFHPAWADPTRATLGSARGDSGLFVWFLRWTQYALDHQQSLFFSDHMNVPDGVNVMWNTSLVLPGLLLAPLTRAFGPILTYNVIITAAPALSAWSGYLAVRRFVPSRLPAAAAGLVYGFSPAMYAQSRGHVHMALMILPPLFLIALHELLVRQRWNVLLAGGLFGLVGACQLLTGEEVLAFITICCFLLLVVLLALFPRTVARKGWYALRGLGVAVVVFAGLAAAPLWAQLRGPQHVDGDIQTGSRFVSDLLGFVLPTSNQLIAPHAAVEISSRFTGNLAEWNAYLGIPLLLVVLFTVVRWWRSAVVRVAALLLVLVALLSMGPNLHIGGRVTGVTLPWEVVDSWPLLESGVSGRLMLCAWLFAALLLGFFLYQLGQGGWLGRTAAVVSFAVVAASLLPQGPIGGGPSDIPAFFTGPGVERVPEGSTALVLPFPGRGEATAMAWQAAADMRFKMPGGYFIGPDAQGGPRFGPAPTTVSHVTARIRSEGLRVPVVAGRLRSWLADDLTSWQVRTVIAGPSPDHAAAVEFVTAMLGRAPEHVGGVEVWWNVDPAAVRAIADPRAKVTAAKPKPVAKAKHRKRRHRRK